MSFRVGTLTEEPLSTFAKLRLAAYRAVASPIAPWTSPELSIGQSCSSLGGLKCWEVKGPALSMSVGILKSVKELLDPVAEYLHEKEPKPSFIAFGIYMIGRDEPRSNPTLLISCERKTPRQKAVRLIRESSILKEVMGLRLAESPRPPLCSISPITLHFPNDDRKEITYRIPTHSSLYWMPTGATCGISVYSKGFQGTDEFYTQKTTMGGLVSLNGGIYGLSTAHGFLEDLEPELPPQPDDETEFEISFDDWIEGDETHESVGDYSEVLRPAAIVNEETTVEENVPQSSLGSEYSSRLPRGRCGSVYRSSLINGDIGLDWALIEKNHLQLGSENRVLLGDDTFPKGYGQPSMIQVRQISEGGPVRGTVLAITGTSGIISGLMSQSSTFMKIPYGKLFQEMWTIRLDGDINRGDSGSWVVDSSTGNLLGHIVSGCPGTGIAYIIPAKHIAMDIKETQHCELNLPSDAIVNRMNDLVVKMMIFARRLYRQSSIVDLELSRMLRGLSVALKHLKFELNVSGTVLYRDHLLYRGELESFCVQCNETLKALDKTLRKYRLLIGQHDQSWARNHYKSTEMEELRSTKTQLVTHQTRLNRFRNEFPYSANLQPRRRLHGILSMLDMIIERRTRPGGKQPDHPGKRKTWDQYRKELVLIGYSSELLEQYEVVLKEYLHELEQNSIEETGKSPRSRSESPTPVTPGHDRFHYAKKDLRSQDLNSKFGHNHEMNRVREELEYYRRHAKPNEDKGIVQESEVEEEIS